MRVEFSKNFYEGDTYLPTETSRKKLQGHNVLLGEMKGLLDHPTLVLGIRSTQTQLALDRFPSSVYHKSKFLRSQRVKKNYKVMWNNEV